MLKSYKNSKAYKWDQYFKQFETGPDAITNARQRSEAFDRAAAAWVKSKTSGRAWRYIKRAGVVLFAAGIAAGIISFYAAGIVLFAAAVILGLASKA